MADETWESIQRVKSTSVSLREKFKKRKAERENILNNAVSGSSSTNTLPISTTASSSSDIGLELTKKEESPGLGSDQDKIEKENAIEYGLLEILSEVLPPLSSSDILLSLNQKLNNTNISTSVVLNLLEKFAYKDLISIKQGKDKSIVTIVSVEHSKVSAVLQDNKEQLSYKDPRHSSLSAESVDTDSNDTINEPPAKFLCTEDKKFKCDDDVMSLLSAQSIRERETKKVGEEIMELLSKPTAKEQSLAQRFRSQGGAKVQEFCPHGTKEECTKQQNNKTHKCGKLHFRKIIQKHTDEALGDCSFLNTCFHMDSCRYVHYEVDYSGLIDQPEQSPIQLTKSDLSLDKSSSDNRSLVPFPPRARMDERTILFPPQWIQCDLRYLDMSILGKFAVIMADPPWDIHMELPYGTMSDDEMRQLSVPTVQDEGLIFLWVTGRAMELGRECLLLWGYERVDEIIWVKTNQLQRIIRTGRTGHWLNHGKEHCLVGMKGNPRINKWLDCDIIVAEVRATSHKPDEIYGIIERLSPGTRKLELFGRPHNVQPNWLTLGNQLEETNLLEEPLVKAFKEHYPDGICRKAD